jgi:hypothetical protein
MCGRGEVPGGLCLRHIDIQAERSAYVGGVPRTSDSLTNGIGSEQSAQKPHNAVASRCLFQLFITLLGDLTDRKFASFVGTTCFLTGFE